jgi:UMF1 family MFS transporter
LASAGLWWGGFALISIFGLQQVNTFKQNTDKNIIRASFGGFLKTLKESTAFPLTLLFLVAYTLYNDGVQAVIVVSSQFGQEAIGLDIGTLTSVILMVQFVAYFGAIIFSKVAKLISTKKALLISIIIWLLIVYYSYSFLNSALEFWILGAVIGLVLGGTQALSRSMYSLLIPKGKDAEYFSLYELSERGTSWIGPLLFGLSLQLTDSYRVAIFSLGILFFTGFLLLLLIDVKKGIESSGNTVPDNY